MKTSRTYFTFSLIFSILISISSCKKDDAPIDPSTPQVVLPADYVVLKALYDANTGTTLDWDFDDTYYVPQSNGEDEATYLVVDPNMTTTQ